MTFTKTNSETIKKYDCPILKLNQVDDQYKIQLVAPQTQNYPYHLKLDKMISPITDKLSFHLVGDTGGMLFPEAQRNIALAMQQQAQSIEDPTAFLYHLGDVVYHYGEAEHYDAQFFEPYQNYSQPIFAIAGNHDSDINADNILPYQSLDAFKSVFCDSESRHIAFNKNKGRKSMVQPNIYWTLQTPLANIIGLHSNVPKYGFIDNEQRDWFVEELKTAAKDRPHQLIIVCIHHAPYSADVNHGSSLPIITFLENAFKKSGVRPDIIFSGHVHNYQRFHKKYKDGQTLPFVVCGAGGFDELHELATTDDPAYAVDQQLFEGIQLMNYCDSMHGFLKIMLERTATGISLSGTYFALSNDNRETQIRDSFAYLF